MDDTLSELRKKEEEDLARVLATRHGIPYLDLSRITIDLDALKLIPENDARANGIAVIQGIGKKLQIVVTNPERPGVKEILDSLQRKKYEIQLFMVSPSGTERVFLKYKEIPRFEEIKAGIVDVSPEKLSALETSAGSFKKFVGRGGIGYSHGTRGNGNENQAKNRRRTAKRDRHTNAIVPTSARAH